MAQYTKHNSNYIKTNIHQKLKDGSTIFERDWVTIGSQLHFGPGKIPYYTNGNFIFTTSPIPHYQKRYKNGVAVGLWTYDDVKNATNVVNKINNDEYTEDIRTYAYYGSCLELVRSSIEHIISNFPGNITVSDTEIEINKKKYYVLNNPFGIILNEKEAQLTQYDNELHYLSYSWDKYEIKSGEESVDIISYEIITEATPNCVKELDKVYTITINENTQNKIVIEAYIYDGEIVPVVKAKDDENENEILKGIVIQPKKDYIESYFNSLQGFEKQLLTRKTKPLYSNTFITPIEYNLGYLYYKRTYTWPSNGYCIDITSTTYIDFLDKLTSMAEIYDELWTDNLWRRMTHEAIKNYDWTYTKEFEDGEEQDNIDGGERMHKVLNIIGRVFDDVKQNIDLVKRNNRITYNGDRNIPNALLSDKLELMGWDAYSTISTYTTNDGREIPASEVKIDDNFLKENNINWYGTKNNKELTFTDVDVNFMRKMLLSSKYILKTKGTRAAIDMIMGMFGYGLNGEDYSIIETYRKVKPKMYDYFEDPEEEVFGDKIVRLNAYKENERIYPDDEVSGIPVGSFKMQTNIGDICEFTTYLIPYYDQRKMYDGDFTFQSKGGWFYNGEERWMPNKQYYRCDIVFYDGSIWRCIKDNKDQTVFNKDYFEEVEIKEWKANKQYYIGDRVFYNGRIWHYEENNSGYLDEDALGGIWRCKEDNTGYYDEAEGEVVFSDRYFEKVVEIDEWKANTQYRCDILSYKDSIWRCTKDNKEDKFIECYFEEVEIDEWKANTQYYRGDKVSNGGRIWRCTKDDNTGQTVFNENYFVEVAEIKEWETNTQYRCDRVIYEDSIWRCIENNKEEEFSEDYFEKEEKRNQFKWTETLSYLHVVPTIKDLLNVNPNSVTNGNIYYVSNVNDYIGYTEEATLKSNFFVLNNDFAPDIFSSWENIDLNDPNDENAERAKYLDNIILNTLGNNPHVGFGGYDKGETYFEYMKKPFKYAIDRNFFSYEDMKEAEEILFEIDEKDTEAIKSSDKIKIFADQDDIEKIEDITQDDKKLTKVIYVNIYKNDEILTEDKDGWKPNNEYNKGDRVFYVGRIWHHEADNVGLGYYYEDTLGGIWRCIKDNTNQTVFSDEYFEKEFNYRKCAEYNKEAVREAKKNIYYLNSKVVYFENKIDNEQYKKYFKNVIMKYLMQVIPSTTILILQGFE